MLENLTTTSYFQDELSLQTMLLNLLVAGVLSLLLKWHFEKFSTTLSGKKELARVIPFLVLIVCLIISIVKSSLALSLGLVGALSIVRFRTPIKEPEELVYLFMAIAIGLGLGANQMIPTLIATLFILFLVSIIKYQFYNKSETDLYLTVSWNDSEDKIDRDKLSFLISEQCNFTELKRIDITKDETQIIYFINVTKQDDVFKLTKDISSKYPAANVTFIDQSRVPGI